MQHGYTHIHWISITNILLFFVLNGNYSDWLNRVEPICFFKRNTIIFLLVRSIDQCDVPLLTEIWRLSKHLCPTLHLCALAQLHPRTDFPLTILVQVFPRFERFFVSKQQSQGLFYVVHLLSFLCWKWHVFFSSHYHFIINTCNTVLLKFINAMFWIWIFYYSASIPKYRIHESLKNKSYVYSRFFSRSWCDSWNVRQISGYQFLLPFSPMTFWPLVKRLHIQETIVIPMQAYPQWLAFLWSWCKQTPSLTTMNNPHV